MQIIVISPESEDPRERAAMEGFFAAGLERYHVRKPSWDAPRLEAWLRGLPVGWRQRLVLHEHHALAHLLGLAGRHEKDASLRAEGPSRSCHELSSLRRYLGTFDQVIFGPVFPSLTKPGYGPAADLDWDRLKALLEEHGRGRTFAIGGVTAARLARCGELGFDGAAVLGAVWNETDPVLAFAGLLDAAGRLGASRHAA